MNIFKKLQMLRRRRKVNSAVDKYNVALVSLAHAAAELGEAIQEAGAMTETVSEAIAQMQDLTNKALISPKDLQRGGATNGKG